MKHVFQQGGGRVTLHTHCSRTYIMYIGIARRLNTMFNLELASFKFIARMLIRDRQKNVH